LLVVIAENFRRKIQIAGIFLLDKQTSTQPKSTFHSSFSHFPAFVRSTAIVKKISIKFTLKTKTKIERFEVDAASQRAENKVEREKIMNRDT
jgi:hypothetical protein